MAQPNPYNRAYNFANFQSENPTTPLPATQLEIELSRIKAVIDQIRTSIAFMQRDDYAIANRSVGYDQLKTEVEIGVNPPSTWATTPNYIARDSVFHEANFYICLVSHVSGTFAVDLAADKWELIASFEAATSASAVSYDNATSGLVATTVQAAIDELENLVTTGSVLSFNGRSGVVVPAAGDYTAADVAFAPAGSIAATDVRAAIEELDGDLAGKAALIHTHAQADVTNLVTDLAAKVPTSRSVTGGGLVTGGGDLSASRTLTVTAASQAQAEAGASTAVAMTPLATKQAIDNRIYSGTSSSNTDFPVGTTLLVRANAGIPRNSTITIHLFSGVDRFVHAAIDSSGAQLSGTWRTRGAMTGNTLDYVFAEKVQ
jgi:hypothetical protein